MWVVCFAVGCANVPAELPAASAASERAVAAPVVSVATALRSDPPLPGEPSGNWTGLAADGGAAMPHHHGMNMTDGAHAP